MNEVLASVAHLFDLWPLALVGAVVVAFFVFAFSTK